MALRRSVTSLLPRLLQQEVAVTSSFSQKFSLASSEEKSTPEQRPSFGSHFRSFASDAVAKSAGSSVVSPTAASDISMSPSSKITYNELNHVRYEPVPVGEESRPFAYFVLTGGRFLYASAIRLVVLKGLLSLGAAADTLAMSSLEVDLSSLEEGSTIVVKWRGKPVFIKYRSEEDINAMTSVPLGDLKDPQADVERAVDPKGPAPYNLEVPEYKYMGDNKLIIG
eukprot:gene24572-10183_t